MTVLVTMQVGPVDKAKFMTADRGMIEKGMPPGMHSHRVYFREGDPATALVVQEWDSHTVFNEFSDEVGEQFNHDAGTEGLDWVTGVWELEAKNP
jgi:hypothetical protein